MKFSDVELPSNRKFGLFFTIIFVIVAGYLFFISKFVTIAGVFLFFAVVFCITTLVKPNLLLPLNRLWMRFGFLLGLIISPFVLGLIYFLLFTPIAIIMRFRGRDELRLKFEEKNSYWINRGTSEQSSTFKNQF